MERDWLDDMLVLGVDIFLLIVVGVFALDAVEPSVRRWRDRIRARRSAVEPQRPIDLPDPAVAAVSALPHSELEPQIATPEWLDRLLSGSTEVAVRSPARPKVEGSCRAAEDVA